MPPANDAYSPKAGKGTQMKIGFIGLGRMGPHVAANLLKAGHQVTVWNRSPAPVQALVAKGAIAAKRRKRR